MTGAADWPLALAPTGVKDRAAVDLLLALALTGEMTGAADCLLA